MTIALSNIPFILEIKIKKSNLKNKKKGGKKESSEEKKRKERDNK